MNIEWFVEINNAKKPIIPIEYLLENSYLGSFKSFFYMNFKLNLLTWMNYILLEMQAKIIFEFIVFSNSEWSVHSLSAINIDLLL